ncbi:MAG TPA: hypothetical protein VFW89_07710 [Gemmatimonadaceae bacterium]|nr:hypothetical protein [Gemmatimonadaceae bacterium]
MPAVVNDDADGTRMIQVDSLGIGYTVNRGRIVVHYPGRNLEEGASGRYGAGFELGPIPESYWSSPPNEITKERAGIWRRLLDDAAREASGQ